MISIESMAAAILDRLAPHAVVEEFKRTVQNDDGSTDTFRIDLTGITESHFTAAVVRQRNDGPRQELGPRQFARSDVQGFARWLASDPPR